ncbi:IM protein of drug ABC transporter (DRI:YHIH) [Propionibacterium freudenreichii]|uniref:Abc-type multidrug transport system, permease component protein n=1 Tax=Propionibacterium freudenreichii TaxID=1744 RepID=A0A2C7AVL4_9ACTN|nr:ABC transporter permease [Propionibacterium freudenreichii]MCT3019241.1 ABC transporter permease [Propionibacterium freudenreichii]CEG90077.1 IM protein of drug ABC transporter (DRI:YHIH) [Propionibacterium freudenreichii]CEG96600.1 IM protein of drug ABC transporter (DRI:YHIH) [Propionibacterium freudenreichii]CUW05190.1 IM protein of drug ABC transporter (DRI:YHIH) [Propionibacterium freudenreichii subsp. shermanii]SPB30569.1 Inner membrane transport permease YbhR [Propionibacterium freud
MRALVVKEFQELVRDRRTLAMLLLLPLLLLVIFGYAANFSVSKVSVTVIGRDAPTLADDLSRYPVAGQNLDISTAAGATDPEQLLRERRADVVVQAVEESTSATPSSAPISERMHVYADGSRLFAAQAAQRAFTTLVAQDTQQHLARIQASAAAGASGGSATQGSAAAGGAAQAASNPGSVVTVLFNPDLKTSWVMVPGLIGLILTFIGTVITSIGLVRERETGTLEQLAVVPLRSSSIILGKIIPYFLLALFDMVLITAVGVWLFGVPFRGSLLLFAAAAVIFLFVVLGFGVLISTASQTTGQAIQLAIMTVLPQVLLSGLIFPLDSMAAGVRWIGYCLPLTWFNQIAQGIMLRDAPAGSLLWPFVILAAMAVVFFGIATLRMRFSLTHGGARA